MEAKVSKHMQNKIDKLVSLYFILLCALRFCKMKKINPYRIKVLDYIIADELDELADYFKYRK